MSAPTVRQAVACRAWHGDDYGSDHVHVMQGSPEIGDEWPVTAVDGTEAQIAARVRAAISESEQDIGDDPVSVLTARVLAALGIHLEGAKG
jgi:hypothetical protein